MREECPDEVWGTPAFKDGVAVKNSAQSQVWHEMEEEGWCGVPEAGSSKGKLFQARGWSTVWSVPERHVTCG